MNIERISDQLSTGRLARLGAIKSAASKQAESKTVSARDQADTSRLSRLMSRGAGELGSLAQPRSDKVAAYRGTIDEPINLSDHVVNTIFNRMING